jgi:DNA polymerase-3 subunit delta
MAAARFVLVRSADAMAAAELDRLGEYVASPSPSTCVVILAEKLDGRTKLAREAKKADALVTVGPLKGGAVRSFVTAEAKARKHAIAGPAVEALVDATGEDLSTIDDALERLSLYVGPGAPITLEAVEQCVTRVRTESIWALVDSISASDARSALRAAASLLADREAPLRILGMIARQLRIVARMRQELAGGADERDAAVAAGAPPFKARELKAAARRFSAQRLAVAFDVLLRADRDLKGSRVPSDVVLEEAVLRLCRPEETRRARIQRRLPTLASR